MNVISHPSVDGKQRLMSLKGEPLFRADWLRAVFLHFEADAAVVRDAVPFPLDLRDGKAFLSAVAFTMERLRPRFGGRLGALLVAPVANHGFLNVRTYVQVRGEPGIYFLAEWLSNPLSVPLGPPAYGLPYRPGKLDYRHCHERGQVEGDIRAGKNRGQLSYRGAVAPEVRFSPCEPETLDEFLMERYTAFTRRAGIERFFRIWHPPWPRARLDLSHLDCSLLTDVWPWFREARFIGAGYSPGVQDVWMGWPHRCSRLRARERRFTKRRRLASFYRMP